MCCRAKGSDCSTSLRLQFGRFLLESPGRQWAHPFQLDDQSILLLMWWRKRAADQSNAAIYRRRWCRCTNSSGSTFGVRHIMERIKRERERKRRNFFCLIRQLRTNHISPGETLLTGSQRRPARKCVQCAFNWNVTARIDRPQKEKRPPSRRISKKNPSISVWLRWRTGWNHPVRRRHDYDTQQKCFWLDGNWIFLLFWRRL